MTISVIIPVHNTRDYVAEAVSSALDQPETAEVILVDDYSTDGSREVCVKLASEHSQVKFFSHECQHNLGAGAARNIGIRAAESDYIAFLDSDDYYLENRFGSVAEELRKDESIDGIYEALGTRFESREARDRYFQRLDSTLTTVIHEVPPEELGERLLRSDAGHFSGDALLVRRALFEKTGLFDENLEIGEDTVMWIKMAIKGRLKGGRLFTPVAMRRVHSSNTSFGCPERFHRYQSEIYATLWHWSMTTNVSLKHKALILRRWLIEEADYMNVVGKDSIWGRRVEMFMLALSQEPLLVLSPVVVEFVSRGLITKALGR